MAKNKLNSMVVWLFLAAVVGYYLYGTFRPEEGFAAGGAPLPPLTVSDWINVDQPLTDEDLQGQVVFVDCWASWCGPCLAKMPGVVKLRDRFRDQDVTFIGITSEDGGEVQNVVRVLEGMPEIDWPIGYGGRAMFGALGVSTIPTLFVFDRQGNGVYRGRNLAQAEAAMVQALAGG